MPVCVYVCVDCLHLNSLTEFSLTSFFKGPVAPLDAVTDQQLSPPVCDVRKRHL